MLSFLGRIIADQFFLRLESCCQDYASFFSVIAVSWAVKRGKSRSCERLLVGARCVVVRALEDLKLVIHSLELPLIVVS